MKAELWLVIDADENYWVSDDRDDAISKWTDGEGVAPCRVVKIVVGCDAPKAQIVTCTLPPEDGEVVIKSMEDA